MMCAQFQLHLNWVDVLILHSFPILGIQLTSTVAWVFHIDSD